MNNIHSYNLLTNVFSSIGDEVFIVDFDGNIKFKNESANKKYPKIKNINKLAHLFNFAYCFLQKNRPGFFRDGNISLAKPRRP